METNPNLLAIFLDDLREGKLSFEFCFYLDHTLEFRLPNLLINKQNNVPLSPKHLIFFYEFN